MVSHNCNILFRVSGGRAVGKELGLGHVFRCINLANQLKSAHIFFLVEDYGRVIQVLKKRRFRNCYKLKGQIPLNQDVKKTIQIIESKKIGILIIDKYDLATKKYVKEVKKIVKTVVISDLRKIDYDADLVVNGFIGFKNKITRNRFGSKCLLGPKYQILPKNYEKHSRPKKKTITLLATFGGFDENNIAYTLCKQLEKYLGEINAKIILGPATIKSQKIKHFALSHKKNLEIVSEVKDLKNEIAHSKFGLCGGGITTYEFSTMGTPFAIICQYNHQLLTAREWNKKKMAINLGLPDKKIKRKFEKLLKNLVEDKISVKHVKNRIVDGLGARRVANEIMKI